MEIVLEDKYPLMLENLKNKVNFSVSRFGDGEWNCILGKAGSNRDGHKYFPDMGRRLSNVLINNRSYWFGLQNSAYRTYPDQIHKYIIDYGVDFIKSDFLHHASIKGNLHNFFESLEGREIVLIGPQRLSNLKQIKFKEHIVIPEKDCWNEYKNVLTELLKYAKQNVVFIYCASMMTNVLIDDMYTTYGNRITQIDCGSVFEPYVNVRNRSYHKNIIARENAKN